jgi:succinyl-diaminopimelate desuccinylase
MLTHVKSAQAWLAVEKRLPINLKYLIEGEEEVGSANLDPFIEQNRDRLKCDCVVVSDTSQFAPGIPAITYGLRGLAYFELRLTGPKQDLHSGTFGGSVMNPAIALAKLLAAMIGPDGRIQLPGFYDDVVPLTDAERRQFAVLPFDEAAYLKQLGVASVAGETGYSTLERRWARPTFDIHGLTSGYQGDGAKTVLPARASAKFSFRLVPNQDPAKVAAAVRSFVKLCCPIGVTYELVEHHGAPGVVVPLDSPYVAAASRAIERSFGRAPVFMREGGSIPVVATFKKLLGVDTLLLGWGRDDDNTHSPNEKFNLDDYHKGIKASAYLWQELAGISQKSE